ncbi:hypothetical protein ACIOGZ_29805 [Kitasatospora sp. NPDC088160]|uniref:hypothetical protein n=1 Tax=Kitasatospora sp. NPDC088160 TaxID=3364072 RepID=UPI00381F8D6F
MTAPDETLDAITAWFANVEYAGLILPSGWFGRPFDNQHQLTWAHVRHGKLLLELDERLLLVLTAPGAPSIDGQNLIVTFAQLVFDWQGYGDLQPHAEAFRTGELQFVGHPMPTA